MRALKRKETRVSSEKAVEEKVIQFPVPGNLATAARVLSDFTSEARGVLSRLEEALSRTEVLPPEDRVRRDFLRFLADQEDWVELHDVPPVGSLGRSGARSLARQSAKGGLVAMQRDATYPNLIFLKITLAGRERLRQMGVAEAMGYLTGSDGKLEAAAEDALRALRRLAELSE